MGELEDPRKIEFVGWLLDRAAGCQQPETLEGFAATLGVSRKTLYLWERQPEVDQAFRDSLMRNAGPPERFAMLVDEMFAQALDGGSSKQIQAANWIKDTFGLAEKAKADVKSASEQRDELMGLSVAELDRLLEQQGLKQ